MLTTLRDDLPPRSHARSIRLGAALLEGRGLASVASSAADRNTPTAHEHAQRDETRQPLRHYARRAWHRPGGSMSRSAANPNRRRSLPLGTEQNRRSTTRTLPTERKRHGLRPPIAQRHDETPFRTQRSRTQFVCGAVLYAGRVIRSVGERLWAIPIDALWGGSAPNKRTDVSPQDRRASTVTTASRSTHADKHADKQAARRRPKTHR